METKIPKILHVTWFGPKEMVWKYEKEVKEMYSKDWEIKVWTGESLDFVEDNAFVKFAKETKKWVFVNDYYRIKILEKYGGVYIDTDMLPMKIITDDMLDTELLMGYEFRNFITTGMCGTIPNGEYITRMVQYYDALIDPSFVPLSNLIATEVIYSIYDIGVANKTRKLDNAIIMNRRAFGLWNESNRGTYFIHKHNSLWIKYKFQRTLLELGAKLSKLTPAFSTTIMSSHQRKMTTKRFKEKLEGMDNYLISNKDMLDKEDFHNIINSNKWINVHLENSNKYLVKTLKKLPNVKKVVLKGKSKFKPGKFETVHFNTVDSDFIVYNPKRRFLRRRAKFESDHNIIEKQFLIADREKILMK